MLESCTAKDKEKLLFEISPELVPGSHQEILHQFDLPTSDDLFHCFDFLQGEPAQYMFESPRLNFL